MHPEGPECPTSRGCRFALQSSTFPQSRVPLTTFADIKLQPHYAAIPHPGGSLNFSDAKRQSRTRARFEERVWLRPVRPGQEAAVSAVLPVRDNVEFLPTAVANQSASRCPRRDAGAAGRRVAPHLLMKDQVAALHSKGLPVRYNSQLTRVRSRIARAPPTAGEIKALRRSRSGSPTGGLRSACGGRVSSAQRDEAH